MGIRKFRPLLGLLAALFFTAAAWGGELTIHIIDVGQGDCQLIVSPSGQTVLIDAGNNDKGYDVVYPYLDGLGITNLDYIVASHYHADHIGGLDEVVERLKGISNINYAVYDHGGAYDSDSFDDYVQAMGAKRTQIIPGEVIELGDGVTLRCIASGGKTVNGTFYSGTSNENNLGVVLVLDYGDFQMHLGGDLEKTMEKAAAPLAGDMDVYKVNHHGSNSSSVQEFLETIQPEVSTIPVGGGRRYHPTDEVIERLMNIGSYIYQTEAEPGQPQPPAGYGEVAGGSFTIRTGGCTYTISGSNLLEKVLETDGSHGGCNNAVVFSEVLYDSTVSGDTDGEWLELYNPADAAVDVGNWTIEDNHSVYRIPSGTFIGAHASLVIAADGATFTREYGCDPDLSGLTLALNNDGDYLILSDNNDNAVDQVAWESGGANISGWGSSSRPYAGAGNSIARAELSRDTGTYADWLDNQAPGPDINKPRIILNREILSFGASGGVTTGTQTFLVGNSGCGALEWEVSDNASWLTVTPTSGTGSAFIDVAAAGDNLFPGTYTGTVTVRASNASNSPRSVQVTLTVHGAGSTSGPFGEFASPAHGSRVENCVPVTGWVLDDIGVAGVQIFCDSRYIGDAVMVEGARHDVEDSHPGYPENYRAGWGYMLLTRFLPNGGNGTYTLCAKALDLEGNLSVLGTKTIEIDNANSITPFGAIDTPAPGGTASGGEFINWGWVLAPRPNMIPTDGSTINIFVDGKPLDHPEYGLYREDIAGYFPGYANSNGALGYLKLDTTGYSNGVHIIQWSAADSAGNAAGIDSRYFMVWNQEGQRGRRLGARAGRTGWERNPLPGIRPGPRREFFSEIPVDYFTPVVRKTGLPGSVKSRDIYPDDKGTVTIEARELERVEVHLGNSLESCLGYLDTGNRLRPLPTGSTLDVQKGVFYWTPGPGFLGEYHLIFISKSAPAPLKKRVKIRIMPRF